MECFRNKKVTKYVLAVWFLATAFYVLSLGLRMDTVTERVEGNAQKKSIGLSTVPSTSPNGCGQEEAFTYIPSATACQWAQTEFLIVFGALSVDNDGRRRRRNLQRATCWTFPGVATKANDYNGSMLVLYTLARNPLHNYTYSKSLVLEAKHWHDILTIPVDEGRVTTNKTIGAEGNWGIEAEIGMGRKTFFWLQLALRAFPRTIHIGKCDDDMFMQVPQYLADLRLLPREKIYWGSYVSIKVVKNKKRERVTVNFMMGYGMALARDTAEAVVSYEPLRTLVSLPYSKEREIDFLLMTVNWEDIMVGRALKESGYPVVFVADATRCRFHYSRGASLPRSTLWKSVVINHVKEHEYHTYMSYFIENNIKIWNTTINKVSPNFYSVRCPIT